MELLVTIGLDGDLVARLRAELGARVVAYPAVPRLYALDGRTFVESATVAGRWLAPRGIVFYGYFDGASAARRALALSATPTFPDVASTLPLDDRALSLVLASRADGMARASGFLPLGTSVVVDREHVLKWGDRHCGEDKTRAVGEIAADRDTVIEPFLDGRSERVLLVGERVWQLRYESADWRKNVEATVREIAPAPALIERATRTTRALGLAIAGVDYIVDDSQATLLEINAYPGFDDVPAAADAFIELVRAWWTSVLETS